MPEQPQSDETELQQLLRATLERNEALQALVVTVSGNTAAVTRLREDVVARPTRRTVERARRRVVALSVLLALFTGFVADEHTQRCGPGARSSRVVAGFVDLPTDATPAQVQAVRRRFIAQASPWCDVLSPLHSHDEDPWPTEASLLGLLLYSIGACALTLWTRGPRADEDESYKQKVDHD